MASSISASLPSLSLISLGQSTGPGSMGSVAALASAANPRVLSAVELTIASQGAIQAAVASQSAQNVNRWIDIFDTANMSIEGIQQTINAMYDLALRGAAIGLSDTVRQRIYEGIEELRGEANALALSTKVNGVSVIASYETPPVVTGLASTMASQSALEVNPTLSITQALTGGTATGATSTSLTTTLVGSANPSVIEITNTTGNFSSKSEDDVTYQTASVSSASLNADSTLSWTQGTNTYTLAGSISYTSASAIASAIGSSSYGGTFTASAVGNTITIKENVSTLDTINVTRSESQTSNIVRKDNDDLQNATITLANLLAGSTLSWKQDNNTYTLAGSSSYTSASAIASAIGSSYGGTFTASAVGNTITIEENNHSLEPFTFSFDRVESSSASFARTSDDTYSQAKIDLQSMTSKSDVLSWQYGTATFTLAGSGSLNNPAAIANALNKDTTISNSFFATSDTTSVFLKAKTTTNNIEHLKKTSTITADGTKTPDDNPTYTGGLSFDLTTAITNRASALNVTFDVAGGSTYDTTYKYSNTISSTKDIDSFVTTFNANNTFIQALHESSTSNTVRFYTTTATGTNPADFEAPGNNKAEYTYRSQGKSLPGSLTPTLISNGEVSATLGGWTTINDGANNPGPVTYATGDVLTFDVVSGPGSGSNVHLGTYNFTVKSTLVSEIASDITSSSKDLGNVTAIADGDYLKLTAAAGDDVVFKGLARGAVSGTLVTDFNNKGGSVSINDLISKDKVIIDADSATYTLTATSSSLSSESTLVSASSTSFVAGTTTTFTLDSSALDITSVRVQRSNWSGTSGVNEQKGGSVSINDLISNDKVIIGADSATYTLTATSSSLSSESTLVSASSTSFVAGTTTTFTLDSSALDIKSINLIRIGSPGTYVDLRRGGTATLNDLESGDIITINATSATYTLTATSSSLSSESALVTESSTFVAGTTTTFTLDNSALDITSITRQSSPRANFDVASVYKGEKLTFTFAGTATATWTASSDLTSASSLASSLSGQSDPSLSRLSFTPSGNSLDVRSKVAGLSFNIDITRRATATVNSALFDGTNSSLLRIGTNLYDSEASLTSAGYALSNDKKTITAPTTDAFTAELVTPINLNVSRLDRGQGLTVYEPNGFSTLAINNDVSTLAQLQASIAASSLSNKVQAIERNGHFELVAASGVTIDRASLITPGETTIRGLEILNAGDKVQVTFGGANGRSQSYTAAADIRSVSSIAAALNNALTGITATVSGSDIKLRANTPDDVSVKVFEGVVKFSNLTQIAQGTTLSIDVSGYDTQTYVAPKTVNGVNDVVASLNASFKGVTVFASGEDVVIATKDANTTVRASLQAKRPESHTHVEPTINLGGTTVRASVLRDARIVPNNQSADGDLFEEVYGAINALSSTQGRTTSNFTALADKLKALDALLESRHANTRLFADAIENVAKTNFVRSSTSGSGSNTADVSLTQLAIETKNAIKASILNNPELSIASIRNASQQMTLTLIEDLTTGTSFMSITKLGASDAASRADRLREFVEATTKADQTLGTTIVERVQATQQSADFRRPQSPLLSD